VVENAFAICGIRSTRARAPAGAHTRFRGGFVALVALAQPPELESADEIVLQCKSGARSARALKLLQEAGFSKLSNLEGGILAWSDQVDSTVAKY
jgi:rhodanese-related sulfurtransferase